MSGQYTHSSDRLVRKIVNSTHFVLLRGSRGLTLPPSMLQATRLECCGMVRAMVLSTASSSHIDEVSELKQM